MRFIQKTEKIAAMALSILRSSTSLATTAREKISTVTVGPAKWVRHLTIQISLE